MKSMYTILVNGDLFPDMHVLLLPDMYVLLSENKTVLVMSLNDLNLKEVKDEINVYYFT